MAATLPTHDEVRAIVREELERVLGRVVPQVLSTETAAELAGVTPKTIREWIAAGLPAGRRGRLRTIQRADLEAWLAGKRESTPTAASLEAGLRRTA